MKAIEDTGEHLAWIPVGSPLIRQDKSCRHRPQSSRAGATSRPSPRYLQPLGSISSKKDSWLPASESSFTQE